MEISELPDLGNMIADICSGSVRKCFIPSFMRHFHLHSSNQYRSPHLFLWGPLTETVSCVPLGEPPACDYLQRHVGGALVWTWKYAQ